MSTALPGQMWLSPPPPPHLQQPATAAAATALESKANHSNPQTAINGFIAMILTLLCSVLYLIWLAVPQPVLHQLHVSYYPDKYWAFAIPAVITMLMIYYLLVSVALVLMTTPPLDDGRCVTDVDSRKDTEMNCGALTSSAGSVAPWADIPVSVASTLLFQPWTEQQ